MPCRCGCASPSIDAIPSLNVDDSQKSVNYSNPVRLYSIVNTNGCESIYIECSPGFVLATYNSFIDTVRIYIMERATVYCGKYQNYYFLKKNDGALNGKMCSNSFDRVNCIRERILSTEELFNISNV